MPEHPFIPSAQDRIKLAAAGVELPQADVLLPARIKAVDSWSIVVAGNLDHRQHVPHWYHTIGSISETELVSAQNSLSLVAPAPGSGFSQFSIDAFTILASPDRWMIQTMKEENCMRILEIANTVFDKLYELVVIAFGINRQLVITTKKFTASDFLSEQMATTDLALPKGKASGQLSYLLHGPGFDTTIQLGVAFVDEHQIVINYNRHHPIVGGSDKPYVDLGAMIEKVAKADWKSATDYAGMLLESVGRTERRRKDGENT